MIVFILLISLFLGLGILFINGKGQSLIAGYNTMSDEEKEKYEPIRLCKFMGKVMFSLTFSMFFFVLSDLLDKLWLMYVGVGMSLSVVVFMIVYMYTGKRFQKTTV